MTIGEVLEKREKAVMEVTNTQNMFIKALGELSEYSYRNSGTSSHWDRTREEELYKDIELTRNMFLAALTAYENLINSELIIVEPNKEES